MGRKSVFAFGGIIAMLLTSTAIAEEFRARLGRVPVDSRTQSTIAGLGHATAELEGDRLTIEGDFAGLLGPATIANLHMGGAVGVRGANRLGDHVTGTIELELPRRDAD